MEEMDHRIEPDGPAEEQAVKPSKISAAWWPFKDTRHEAFADDRARARAFAAVFGTEDGRRVLAQMASWGILDRSAFAGGQADQTAYNLGKRDFMESIIKTIREGING